MPSFFLWSDIGEGAFLLDRLLREGHKVRMHVRSPQAKDIYRGIVPHADVGSPKRDEVVLFDMVGFGEKADRLRNSGYRVIGASNLADMMELDRSFGTALMKKVGIKIPETHSFRDLKQGIEFLKKQRDGMWFYKPYGNQDAGMTYGAEIPELMRFLESSAPRHKPEGFEIQKGMDGCEISLEGWFDGKEFVYPWNSTIEDKKLMAGDKGPRTGCMSNVVWAYEDPNTGLAMRTLKKLEPTLQKMNHVGPVDINMILDEMGDPHGLEWSPRFGYDALQALSMLTQGDFGDQLEKFSQGKLEAFNVDQDNMALTLGLSTPPFPYFELAPKYKGTLLDPSLRRDDNGIMLRDVMIDKSGRLALSGMDGYVATIGVKGTYLPDLRQEVITKTDTFKIPSAQRRPDPVKRYEKVKAELEKLGYDTFNPSVRRSANG